ncbi:siderophore biosynthesis protein [Streptomyces abyssalis]|uniref:Siderophore biosynthesis protein n=1 Tax=Streptomyces abyssalis TaxID=933944 RepID=A0A1E7JN41_9ACTN|nr:siderophore biosynthesis protein [Streptomyces abyssalis]OEU86929.1 siderophore biosynthesis protein [Streptomyces abyssalis]OEU89686.1 siderophore biosynthesis protein [Streptomyces abyssalis]OEV31296.1 siderophore biosynthesis protein [Streptomyces nanshensis]
MQLYLLALNPTDSVTCGFLPAARRRGLRVTLLTDRPEEHTGSLPDGPGTAPVEVLGCDVRDVASVIARISGHRSPDAVFTNSDHLQMQAALAADYFGLPAKDWRAALRTKDKAEMRRHLAAAGADTVWAAEITAGDELSSRLRALEVPFPCVVKPREGVASEDVFLAGSTAELARRCAEIRERRPGAALVVEEYLPGELHTLETLGDGDRLHDLGGFRTRLSPPPCFVERQMTYVHRHPAPVRESVLAQLGVLGVGLGACHTEFVTGDGGRARIIEVNYRAVGDQGDLLLADLLDIPLFEYVLDAHLGVPLPPEPVARTAGAARIDYPCADRGGTLTAAPRACDVREGEVRLAYRPLRAVGERHDLYDTNRDYLGVLRTTGTDQHAVDRAAEEFLAAQRWEITP